MKLRITEDPIAFVVLTIATDGYFAVGRTGASVALSGGTKLYQVTSRAAAKEIAETGILQGSKQEAGQVFAFSKRPTLSQAKQSGARSLETVIEFEVPSTWSTVDRTISSSLQSMARKTDGPIKVSNIGEIHF